MSDAINSSRWAQVRDEFARAADLPPPDQAKFLQALRKRDADLAREVEQMLAVDGDDHKLAIEGRLLRSPVRPPEPRTGTAGALVGSWRLVRPLGEGGMGEIWLAERTDPALHQVAAVKLLRPGATSSHLVRRFHQERQLLARLSHPNIATLLDGGVTQDDRPFLAMEYVDGQPIDEFCEDRNLGLTARLDLFDQVCRAVQFAHVHLVVHRDLKPSNILVSEPGRPVLLDFGISKLLDPSSDDLVETRPEERLLTLTHAAPEQLRGEPPTLATDTWSLGVLLYQLLTGRLPFEFSGESAAQVERTLQESSPPRASERAREPRFARELAGDLDQILARSLHPNPTRRYATAEQLRQDLERYRNGFPVRARPDSVWYRTHKFARRNAGALLTMAVVTAVLAGWGLHAQRQAHAIAHERDRAVRAQESSEAVTDALVDLLRVADPRAHPGGDTLRVMDLPSLGEERVAELDASPEARAELWQTFAAIHRAHSRYPEEQRALEEALQCAEEANLTESVLSIRHSLGLNRLFAAGILAAEPLLRASLREHEEHYGRDHPAIAHPLQSLADAITDSEERESLLRRALALAEQHHPSPSIERSAAWNALGTHYWRTDELGAANDAFTTALTELELVLPEDHPDLLSVRQNVAVCRQRFGDFAGVESELRKLLSSRLRVLGPDTQAVATTNQNLGIQLSNLGRHREAYDRFAEALRITEKIAKSDAARVTRARHNLGIALALTGSVADGLTQADAAGLQLAQMREVSDSEAASFAISRAGVRFASGDVVAVGEVDDLISRLAPERLKRRHGIGSGHVLRGLLRLEAGSAQAALSDFQAAESAFRAIYGPEHPAVLQSICGAELSRRAAGQTWDSRRLRSAYAGCRDWGFLQPAVRERAREALGLGH